MNCEVKECDWIVSTAALFRRDILVQIGGFDVIFYPIYHEEVDLSYRLRKLGYKLIYYPCAFCYHYDKKILKKPSPLAIYLRNRNRLFFVFMNYSLKKLFLWIFYEIRQLVSTFIRRRYILSLGGYKYNIHLIFKSYLTIIKRKNITRIIFRRRNTR